MLEELLQADTDAFLFLNGFHNDFFDFIMYWLSNKYIMIPLYAVFIALIIKFYKKRTILILLFILILITLTDQISSSIIKVLFERLRPCHEPTLDGLVHIVNGKCGGDYGFVSSHAANVFSIAFFLSCIFREKIKYFAIFIFSWAALISYSRIYLGVHYPGDVICGGLLGVGLGYIIYKSWIVFDNKFCKNQDNEL